MKLMDARKVGTTDFPVLVSWSPKSDVFAIVYQNAHVSLHRINWQKVFDCGCLKEGVPDHITWHPEGRYICLVIRRVVYILEVDRGRLMSKYNIPDEVSWLKWRPTSYETVNTDKKTEADCKPRTSKQQIEQKLSLLIFGCKNGSIHVYAGGHVLLYQIKAPSSIPRPRILAADLSDDLQCLETIGYRVKKSEDSEGTDFIFKHYRNFITPALTDTIGNLIFRFSSLRSTWKQTIGQLNALSDSWAKIYDVYNFYISHGRDKPLEDALAQYYELALNRVDSAEINMFLSAGGRDKEVKKKLPTITANSKSLAESIPSIKINITRCAYDIQAICNFIRRYSPVSTDKVKIRLLKKAELAFQELTTFIHHFHCLSQTFADDLIQFMLLITYTIHTFNSTDYITEMFDIRKVLRLLDSKVSKNVFEYYLLNHSFATQHPDEKEENKKSPSAQMQNMLASLSREKLTPEQSSEPEEASKLETPPARSPPKKRRSPRVSSGSESSPNSSDSSPSSSPRKSGSPEKSGHSKADCDFLRNVFRSLGGPNQSIFIDKLLDGVFKIPLVDPDFVYAPYVLFDVEDIAVKVVASDIWMDPETLKTRIFVQLDSRQMYLFEVDCNQNSPTFKSACLTFSRELTTTVFFSTDYLTTVSYDPKDKKEQHVHGRSIVCQLYISEALANCVKKELGHMVIEDGDLCYTLPAPSPVEVHVPVAVEKAGPSLSPILSHVLPMENICPKQIAVSGARKVGILLNKDKNRILLLDLDLATACDEEDTEIFY